MLTVVCFHNSESIPCIHEISHCTYNIYHNNIIMERTIASIATFLIMGSCTYTELSIVVMPESVVTVVRFGICSRCIRQVFSQSSVKMYHECMCSADNVKSIDSVSTPA